MSRPRDGRREGSGHAHQCEMRVGRGSHEPREPDSSEQDDRCGRERGDHEQCGT